MCFFFFSSFLPGFSIPPLSRVGKRKGGVSVDRAWRYRAPRFRPPLRGECLFVLKRVTAPCIELFLFRQNVIYICCTRALRVNTAVQCTAVVQSVRSWPNSWPRVPHEVRYSCPENEGTYFQRYRCWTRQARASNIRAEQTGAHAHFCMQRGVLWFEPRAAEA